MATDLIKFIEEVVEDKFQRNATIRAAYNYDANASPNLRNIFRRFVVLDVVSDRADFDQSYIDTLEAIFGEIDNKQHVMSTVPPRNTILAKPVYNSSMSNKVEASKAMFLYPFFPSHVAMPCKPGEHIWVMFESITDYKSLGYWLCRIVGPDHVDDVNYTHSPREYDTSFAQGESTATAEAKPRYHFKNGLYKVVSIDTETGEKEEIIDPATIQVLPPASMSKNYAEIYENIVRNAIATGKQIMEPVPRYSKKPGELALEGSNNSLIVLGVDQTLSNALSAGSIDMVAGRGTKDYTLGKIAQNELATAELEKHHLFLTGSEGNSDFANDRSRVLITQRTKVDQAFDLSSYNSSVNVNDDVAGDAAIVIKTDKVRIIARSDVQLIVKNFATTTDAAGSTSKDESTEQNQWASITIKPNGDIVFRPSSTGYIKLGDDDADRALLCTAQPVTALGGTIVGAAVQNNAGGSMAGSMGVDARGNCVPMIANTHGTFASKVLVK